VATIFLRPFSFYCVKFIFFLSHVLNCTLRSSENKFAL